jgi:molybdopterin synthase sulfur carrier subunit
MKIRVLYFSVLRERLKRSEETCLLTEAKTVHELAKWLLGDICDSTFLEKSVMYGVNNAYVKANYQLQDGDEVSFIPPVAGG